ncbi:HAD family phosphatase [Candidatus Pacearchaeota archaeon]|nr:HAD family phosphatase [Candidatus Pacearchaeota archaeon]
MGKNISSVKVIAFDFWGVFAKLNPPLNKYLKRQNISLDKYSDQIHNLIVEHDLNKITEQQFFKKCSEIFNFEIPYPLCKYNFQKNDLNDNLIKIVKKLKERYKIALLTNNNKEYCEEFLFKTGLNKLFDVVVLSYEVGYRKPAPEIYQILIRRLKVKPQEILYVDDGASKLIPAKKIGMDTIQYKGKKTDQILRKMTEN